MRKDPAELVQLIWPFVAVATAVGVLLAAVFRISSWWRENEGLADNEHELLSQYREMNRRGELSDEEYRLIKGRLASRIGQSPALPSDGGTHPGKKQTPGLSEKPGV